MPPVPGAHGDLGLPWRLAAWQGVCPLLAPPCCPQGHQCVPPDPVQSPEVGSQDCDQRGWGSKLQGGAAKAPGVPSVGTTGATEVRVLSGDLSASWPSPGLHPPWQSLQGRWDGPCRMLRSAAASYGTPLGREGSCAPQPRSASNLQIKQTTRSRECLGLSLERPRRRAKSHAARMSRLRPSSSSAHVPPAGVGSSRPPRPRLPSSLRGERPLHAPACRERLSMGSPQALPAQRAAGSPSAPGGCLWFPCLGGPRARWGGCGVGRDRTRRGGMG